MVQRRLRSFAAVTVAALLASVAACSNDDAPGPDAAPEGSTAREPVDAPDFVLAVYDAIAALESQLGEEQEFFEVTANAQFTNVFVATDEGTVAVPYLYVDGELQPPAPGQEGASGDTFTAADVDFEPNMILSGVAADLPDTTIDALSVYGDGVGTVYVLGATSKVGGQLDIRVTASGAIVSVDPI